MTAGATRNVSSNTDSRSNSALDGAGNLVITARRVASPPARELDCWYGPCEFTSARLTTHSLVAARRGRVEARMRLPTQPGLWPAFWMMGEDLGRVGWPRSGEIDVMELVGDEPGKVWASAHGPGYIRAGLTAPFDLPHGQTFSDEFHTFGVELSGDELAFDVDGTVYHRVHRRDIGADKVWVFDKPFHVILNLAVGGEWPGSPSASTQLPARLVIDHVAIYR